MMTPAQMAELQTLVKSLRKSLFREAKSSDAGTYKSKFRGSGLQFREHQVYEPGDDVRFIDWKITARLNRPYIKTFEEERLVTLHVIVDASSTMMMGEGSLSKAQAALKLCVLLALASQKNKDKILVTWVSDKRYQTPILKGQAIIPHCLDVALQSGILPHMGDAGAKERKKEVLLRKLKDLKTRLSQGSKKDEATTNNKVEKKELLKSLHRPLLGPVVDHEFVSREDLLGNMQQTVREGLLKKREVILLTDFYQLAPSDFQIYFNRKNFHLVRLKTGLDEHSEKAELPFGFYETFGGNDWAVFLNEEKSEWIKNVTHPKIIQCDLRDQYLDHFLKNFK